MTRRLLHPLVLVALTAMVLLSARLAGAQVTQMTQVRQAARTGTALRVPVATHALARGAVLTADDFEYRDTTLHAAPDTNHVAAGWVTRRVIAAGEVLRAPAVEPPVVVTANTPVEVEWQDDNVRLTLRGIATRNGSLGERVTVRTELGRRMEGTVVAPGRVRID